MKSLFHIPPYNIVDGRLEAGYFFFVKKEFIPAKW